MQVNRITKGQIGVKRWKPKERVFVRVTTDGHHGNWKKRWLEGSMKSQGMLILYKCDEKGERVKMGVELSSVSRILTYHDAIRGGHQTIIPTRFDSWLGITGQSDAVKLRHRLEHVKDLGVFFQTGRYLLLVLFDSDRHVAEWFHWLHGSPEAVVPTMMLSKTAETSTQDLEIPKEVIATSTEKDPVVPPASTAANDEVQQLRWLLRRCRREIGDLILDIENKLAEGRSGEWIPVKCVEL